MMKAGDKGGHTWDYTLNPSAWRWDPLEAIVSAGPLSPGLACTREAAQSLGVDLAALVAAACLWVAPAAHKRNVNVEKPSGAAYPNVCRARSNARERADSLQDGLHGDNGDLLWRALLGVKPSPSSEYAGYRICHVWPNTCFDPRYYTCLANLVLVPAPFVSLVRHEPAVQAALAFRAYELYGWHPREHATPIRPEGYPTTWRLPLRDRTPIGTGGRLTAHALEKRASLPSATGSKNNYTKKQKLPAGSRARTSAATLSVRPKEPCPQCSVLVRKTKLEAHVRNLCPKRLGAPPVPKRQGTPRSSKGASQRASEATGRVWSSSNSRSAPQTHKERCLQCGEPSMPGVGWCKACDSP